jgi:hypothetical protein
MVLLYYPGCTEKSNDSYGPTSDYHCTTSSQKVDTARSAASGGLMARIADRVLEKIVEGLMRCPGIGEEEERAL